MADISVPPGSHGRLWRHGYRQCCGRGDRRQGCSGNGAGGSCSSRCDAEPIDLWRQFIAAETVYNAAEDAEDKADGSIEQAHAAAPECVQKGWVKIYPDPKQDSYEKRQAPAAGYPHLQNLRIWNVSRRTGSSLRQ
jgi:hypothetical protein